MIGIFRNKTGKEENLTSEKTREVTIFLINPTVDGLVGDVVEGRALDNHGSREDTRKRSCIFFMDSQAYISGQAALSARHLLVGTRA